MLCLVLFILLWVLNLITTNVKNLTIRNLLKHQLSKLMPVCLSLNILKIRLFVFSNIVHEDIRALYLLTGKPNFRKINDHLYLGLCG